MKWSSNDIQKVRQLSLQDGLLLIQAWSLLVLVNLMLRWLPFGWILQVLRSMSRKLDDAAFSPPLSHLARLVNVAGRYCPVEATCLVQALVLSWLLNRRGQPTMLRIGVIRGQDTLMAHAWLEWHGQVITDSSDVAAYAAFRPIPMTAHSSQ